MPRPVLVTAAVRTRDSCRETVNTKGTRMQELRLVAVSEDGSYLVLATPGRGTRFMVPIDERLRAATRGHFSRFDQLQIGVESPLRPKEIQARIRAGQTAEEIAEAAGIPVERVRAFEGPVLQERQYIAEQAGRTAIRRPGDTTPGPRLADLVEERLVARGVAVDDDLEWDSWKREDGSWKVRLHFQIAGRPHTAEWIFDTTRRHVSPVDEEAARISSPDELPQETAVTPFVPRRAAERDPAPEPPAAPVADSAPEQQPAAEEEPAAQGAGDAQPAEATGSAGPAGQSGQGQAEPRRKASGGRGRRASVPSWDEIMFSTNRRRD